MDIDDALSDAFDAAHGEPADVQEPVEDAPIDSDEVINDQPEEEVEVPSEEPELEPLDPPARWSTADKEVFASQTRETQELLLKREKDVESYLTKNSQKQAETSKRFEALDQVLEPRRQQWAMEGTNESQIIGQLFSISDYADKDPQGFITWFAQQRGIDLSQTAGQQQVDPVLRQTQQELADIKRKFAEMENYQKESGISDAERTINALIDSGKAPYFDDVREDIAALINANGNLTLEQAYNKAVWANDDTRALLQEEDSKKRAADAKAKAEKAKKAAGLKLDSNKSGDGAVVGSMEDTMAAVYDKMSG